MRTEGKWFKDEAGRTLILRGVNLGGSSKVPARPNGATHIREGFFDHRDVSFVGRPFPLHEADEHFARLRAWGLTFVRLLVTWEAVEHAGPGVHDEEYLDYLVAVVHRAREHGIDLFIDPHQDVWSRFSGGDGAPGWTFEAIGMDVTRFAETGAAIVHASHGDPLPRMIWPTNDGKLAAATMFTLFFGGNDFAPRTSVDGEPVQEFLQRHYVESMVAIARRLEGLPNVAGYGTMNEPSFGFIGAQNVGDVVGLMHMGDTPTPYQAMLLGAGYSQEVAQWGIDLRGMRPVGSRLIDPGGSRAWTEGHDCVWRKNGVWDVDDDGEPRLLRPEHFARVGERAVKPNGYLRDFFERYARAIRAVDPQATIFLEGVPRHPVPRWDRAAIPNVVHAGHWYDGTTVMLKRTLPWLGADFHTGRLVLGRHRVARSFVRQIARLAEEADERMGGVPTLVGEFGIPFDLNGKEAFRTGDFRRQAETLDRSFRALEANLLSGTLWNYTADNDNVRGDQWNGEDFSIFSRDQQSDPTDINSGGRALEAVVRPCAQKVAGTPLEMSFDMRRRIFAFSFRHDEEVEAPTEIFVPEWQYGDGCQVEVSDGQYTLDRSGQRLFYQHTHEQPVHLVILRPADGPLKH